MTDTEEEFESWLKEEIAKFRIINTQSPESPKYTKKKIEGG